MRKMGKWDISIDSDDGDFHQEPKMNLDTTMSGEHNQHGTWYHNGTHSSESEIWVTPDIELGRVEWERKTVRN